MKKITKILALTLALVTLALSCTSCGNLFISKDEKIYMAKNIRENTFIQRGTRKISDKTYEYITESKLEEYTEDTYKTIICMTYYNEMTVKFITNNLAGLSTTSDGTPTDAVVIITLPYKIKSVVSKTAIEKEIDENRVTLIYSSENKEVDIFDRFGINDEITIKYKK